jgi:hypothetical protein
MPSCARLLGWRLIDAKPEIGWVQIAFEAKPEFYNPAGFVQAASWLQCWTTPWARRCW